MFNASLLLDRTQIVRSSLSRLRALALLSLADFRANPDHYAIAEHHLRRALQALLDIGRHVVGEAASWPVTATGWFTCTPPSPTTRCGSSFRPTWTL